MSSETLSTQPPPLPGTPKSDPVLIMEGVRRSFGGMLAVDVDHLEIQRNTITALIGPNGAGKTTLFNLLTGFDRPDTGSWEFEGKRNRHPIAYQTAKQGMVRTFQLTKALARLTVIENMLLGNQHQPGEQIGPALFPFLWRAQEKKATAQAEELLARFNLSQMRDQQAGTLSGGQRKLLEMARALMASPKILLLDEPMAGVNPALRQTIARHICELRDNNLSIVFIEHDMNVVMEISDWIVCLAAGKVIAEGIPEQITQNPAVVDAYLGQIEKETEKTPASLSQADSQSAAQNPVSPPDLRTPAPLVLETPTPGTFIPTRQESLPPPTTRKETKKKPGILLTADRIVAGYLPGIDILHGCTITLNHSELVGIIGPNGAGKSTLLKALFGLVPLRTGTVALSHADITEKPAHELVAMGMGYVPQTHNVFPSLTVEENLQMGLFLSPKNWEERFAFVAELFPLIAKRRKQKAGAMSGGERQLVAMGRALIIGPSVLLLDEPSAGLSPANQDEVFHRITEIKATGVSILIVEQNARRCLQIADRAYVLDQGKNAYTGVAKDLLTDPKVIELYLGTLGQAKQEA